MSSAWIPTESQLVLWLLVALVCALCLLLIGPIRRRAHVKA